MWITCNGLEHLKHQLLMLQTAVDAVDDFKEEMKNKDLHLPRMRERRCDRRSDDEVADIYGGNDYI